MGIYSGFVFLYNFTNNMNFTIILQWNAFESTYIQHDPK